MLAIIMKEKSNKETLVALISIIICLMKMIKSKLIKIIRFLKKRLKIVNRVTIA